MRVVLDITFLMWTFVRHTFRLQTWWTLYSIVSPPTGYSPVYLLRRTRRRVHHYSRSGIQHVFPTALQPARGLLVVPLVRHPRYVTSGTHHAHDSAAFHPQAVCVTICLLKRPYSNTPRTPPPSPYCFVSSLIRSSSLRRISPLFVTHTRCGTAVLLLPYFEHTHAHARFERAR